MVMAAHAAYNDIAEFLDSQGMEEFKDYCRIGQFICEWFWNVKKMNCIYHVDMTVTTKCTLNCAKCNMFIPYYKEKFHYSFEELRNNIDLFFERIDYGTPRHITIIKLPIIQPIPFRPAACQMLLQLLCITFHRMAGKSKIAPDQRGLYIIIKDNEKYVEAGRQKSAEI